MLTPLVVDPAHPFPFISNLSLNLAALIKDEEDSKNQFVRVKIPTKNIPRFIRIPNEISQLSDESSHYFISVEDLIGNNINTLFNGMECINYSFFSSDKRCRFRIKRT